jgi:hypothetical protein
VRGEADAVVGEGVAFDFFFEGAPGLGWALWIQLARLIGAAMVTGAEAMRRVEVSMRRAREGIVLRCMLCSIQRA